MGSEDDNLSIDEVTGHDVLKYLQKVDPNKSTGPDQISPRVIRECHRQLVFPITKIFNKSLTECKVPSQWKLANITPIFKKGDKNRATNYCPISLTSVLSKILEKIVRDKITLFLEKHNLITDNQHGFRNKRSCLTNLLDFFKNIHDNWDSKIPSDVIYLDFQKAFDKVPHLRLLEKLKAHGLSNNLCSWIGDWLTNRKQRVVINGDASDWLEVTSGVPQGSVLGPILFTLYINDLENGVVSKVAKFADDTKIGGKVNTIADCESIQNDLNKLINWSEDWQMKFNVDKCKVMHFGDKNINYKYHMFDVPLMEVNDEKDLGIIISNDLKNSKQCIAASKKANKMLGFIARNFDYKTPDVISKLYTSLVRPHLEYCVQHWSPNLIKDINKLERVQRRATKMIPSLRNLPYEERLKKLNMFSLQKRRLRGDLIEVFKILNKFDNVRYDKMFEIQNDTATRNNGMKLKGKRCNTNIGKNYFNIRVVEHWNKLPAIVVSAKTIDTFKARLDKYFESIGYN